MDPEILPTLKDEELFHVFTSEYEDMIEEGLLEQKNYKEVRYGLNIMFDLYIYFKFKDSHTVGLFREKPKKMIICVQGDGWVKISDFQSELEQRRNIMLKSLNIHFQRQVEDISADYDLKLGGGEKN